MLVPHKSAFISFCLFISALLSGSPSVRDRLIESWNDTQQYFTMKRVKRCYYMSLEYLIGRSLQNAIFNLDIVSQYSKALHGFGYRLEELYDEEKDAALGNGGLGRLAACYLDSMATLGRSFIDMIGQFIYIYIFFLHIFFGLMRCKYPCLFVCNFVEFFFLHVCSLFGYLNY